MESVFIQLLWLGFVVQGHIYAVSSQSNWEHKDVRNQIECSKWTGMNWESMTYELTHLVFRGLNNDVGENLTSYWHFTLNYQREGNCFCAVLLMSLREHYLLLGQTWPNTENYDYGLSFPVLLLLLIHMFGKYIYVRILTFFFFLPESQSDFCKQ